MILIMIDGIVLLVIIVQKMIKTIWFYNNEVNFMKTPVGEITTKEYHFYEWLIIEKKITTENFYEHESDMNNLWNEFSIWYDNLK
jgi:hypothetical protein